MSLEDELPRHVYLGSLWVEKVYYLHVWMWSYCHQCSARPTSHQSEEELRRFGMHLKNLLMLKIDIAVDAISAIPSKVYLCQGLKHYLERSYGLDQWRGKNRRSWSTSLDQSPHLDGSTRSQGLDKLNGSARSHGLDQWHYLDRSHSELVFMFA